MRFDRTHATSIFGQWWWTVDRYTLAAIGIIASIGVVLIMAASPAVAERIGLDSFHFVTRQVIFLILSTITVFVFSLMPPETIGRVSLIGFAFCILLLLAVLLIGTEVKGAQRWLRFPGFSLQPSEFMKPFFIVLTARILAKRNMEGGMKGYGIAVGVYVLVVALFLMQPDFGMTMVVSVVWAAQLFIAGLPMIFVVVVGVLGVAGIVGAYFFFPHVANRIDMFLDPASGDNYQVAKSLEAIRSGGLIGRGPGEGEVKEILPDAHTDFIFAVAGEELGVLVCLVIVLLFGFVVLRGFVRMLEETNLFVVYAAAGLLMQFGIQAIINMGVALNLLPNTGMTLPFISYGGSSTLAISISVGMILAFTRRRYGAALTDS